jgi:hypothetical protein
MKKITQISVFIAPEEYFFIVISFLPNFYIIYIYQVSITYPDKMKNLG